MSLELKITSALGPFLQTTKTRSQLLHVVDQKPAGSKPAAQNFVKKSITCTRLGGITLLGAGEVGIYFFLASCFKLLSVASPDIKERGHLFNNRFKGSCSAVVIVIYAIGSENGARQLMKRIEDYADKKFSSLSQKAEIKFNKILDESRKQRIEAFLKKEGNPAEISPSLWDQQAGEARKKMTEVIAELRSQYPTAPSERKYLLLTNTQRTMRDLIHSIHSFYLINRI